MGMGKSQNLLELAWNVADLEQLHKLAREARVEVADLLGIIEDVASDLERLNVPRRLEALRSKLMTLAKGVSKYRRTKATHIFVFMISPEQRLFKPYAIPVQCVSYAGMKEKRLRDLITDLIQALVRRGMKVAGTFMHHGTSQSIPTCTFSLTPRGLAM